MDEETKKRKADEISAPESNDGPTEANNAEEKQPGDEPPTSIADTPEGSKHEEAETSTMEDVATTEQKGEDDKAPEPMETDKPQQDTDTPQPSEEQQQSEEEEDTRNPYEKMRWIIVENDGSPASLIKLVGLKSLFSKQLPKMPRAYIARLVFDRRHKSVVILSDDPKLKDTDEEIIGAICYRPFDEMRFAEIAFCAVSATHQVKGYGTKLMNLLKKTMVETGIEYTFTYADNFAIGYFLKQGFSRSISMPKGRYYGLIKDYDGGTPMECYIHPSIDFTRVPEMVEAQRNFILKQIEKKTKSRIVYDPLPKNFSPDLEGVSRTNLSAARAFAIPGIEEAGWTMADLVSSTGQGKEATRQKVALKNELLAIIRKIEEQQYAWPFRLPVDTTEVPDYLEVVKEPIDLSTIDKRIRQDNHYKSKQMLFADLMLMVNNCKLYNPDGSPYYSCAVSLEKFLGNIFHDLNK